MVKVVNFCYVSFTRPAPPPHPTNTEISLFSGADIEQYLCPNFALLVSDLPDSAIPEIAAFLVLQS